MNARCRFAIAVLFLLSTGVLASAVHADCILPDGSSAGWLTVFRRDGDCKVHAGIDTFIVQIRAIPFQKVKLTLSDPPIGTITGEHWYFPHTGDRANGVELNVGACMTPNAAVKLGEIYLTVDYNVVSPYACSFWNQGTAQIQNCTGRWLPAGYKGQFLGGLAAYGCPCESCWQCSYSTQFYNLYPPDGATNVPLDAKLSWEPARSGLPGCSLYITRDPSCATGQDITPTPPQCGFFDPGPLSPNTTYYWRPYWYVNDGWGSGATTAMHSFKTVADPLAAESSTWGHVKAMYRD